MKNHPQQNGFTLLELLVVIAIIALLVSVILPSIGRAKELAKRVICLSNLHHMVVAANSYANEYNDSYPIAQYFSATGMYAWDFSRVMDNGEITVVPGLLWEAGTNKKIQQCPSFDGSANWLDDPYTGYNYNTSYIGHGQSESIVEPAEVTDIQNPGQTAIFGDGEYASGANKFMRAPWPNPGDETFNGRWSGTQGYRHLEQTNAAFCDGHAESLVKRFTANANGAENVAEGTGFLSADNSMYGSSAPIVDGFVED